MGARPRPKRRPPSTRYSAGTYVFDTLDANCPDNGIGFEPPEFRFTPLQRLQVLHEIPLLLRSQIEVEDMVVVLDDGT
jgi:hypothetical protein